MKIKEITKVLEDFAAKSLSESYDNVGLLAGNKENEVSGVLLSLDCTEAVLDEAIENNCNLVVSHHPIVFRGLKSITGKNYVERTIIKAIKNDIAIYAAHTNYDNIQAGVNQKIAEKIGLTKTKILAPKNGLMKKLVTFAPKAQAEKVRNAICEAGAGEIGNYSHASFNTEGTGTFKAGAGANPFVGEINKIQREPETKIEVIYENYKESKILKALFNSHPYEEIAYDIFNLENKSEHIGSGMFGILEQPISEKEFIKQIKKTFKTGCVRHTKFLNKKIEKVAVCGGTGSFLLPYAIGSGADVFITADYKYHEFFDADNQILILDIGHFESEQYTPEIFYEVISKKFPNFAPLLSKVNTNPIQYF